MKEYIFSISRLLFEMLSSPRTTLFVLSRYRCHGNSTPEITTHYFVFKERLLSQAGRRQA